MTKLLTFLFIINAVVVTGQTDSIFHLGNYRTFILHLPEGYDEKESYPLVLNLHGNGSSGAEQQFYSAFNPVADAQDLIVVYPDGLDNTWDLFGNTDVLFLSALIDTLCSEYSCNGCFFSMGMSLGGFLSYKLACELPQELKGIAVVTGNMIIPWMTTCASRQGLPVMHFHGTADEIVPYEGSFGVPPVEESVAWWAEKNQCYNVPQITSLPDNDPDDGTTVDEFRYIECPDQNDVLLYSVNNGGHTWPGAFPIPPFGNTTQDIDASVIIGNFFSQHCDATTSVNGESTYDQKIIVYPNPAGKQFYIKYELPGAELIISDMNGNLILKQRLTDQPIKWNHPLTGMYVVTLKNGYETISDKIVILD